MKIILSITFSVFAAVSFSQCYNCNYQHNDRTRAKGPKRAFKKDFPNEKGVKWFSCVDEILYGIHEYSDSSITYIYSTNGLFMGKETRYFSVVPKYLDEPEIEKEVLVKCVSPNILPKNHWEEVATIYQVEDLDTLNKVDGMPFWVCDIYQVEVPDTHIMAQKEGSTTFYIVNMDFQYHIFTRSEKLDHLTYLMEYHPQFYTNAAYYYEEE